MVRGRTRNADLRMHLSKGFINDQHRAALGEIEREREQVRARIEPPIRIVGIDDNHCAMLARDLRKRCNLINRMPGGGKHRAILTVSRESMATLPRPARTESWRISGWVPAAAIARMSPHP